MDMPRPTDAHRRLERLVGSWQGEERLFPSPWDPQGGPAVGRVENRLALDGFAVVQDYEQERHGAVTFRGHGIFRWDAGRSLYIFHWFDSMGQAPSEFHGAFDGDVLTLVSPMPQGHSRAVFDLSHEGRYHYRMDISPDAEHWHPFMEGDYVRTGSGRA